MEGAPIQKPGLRSREDSIRFTSPEIATGLRAILGARLVAYIGHATSTRAVGEWADGSMKPPAETLERLRAAYHVAALLAERESSATVQSWFQGINPQLNDQVPARLLRDEPVNVVGPEVVAAARSFAFVG